MKPITYWIDAPAVQDLCAAYGSRLEKMPAADKTGILATLAIATHELSINGGECAQLDEIADLIEIGISDDILEFLEAVDEELDAADLLCLARGILESISASDLEG